MKFELPKTFMGVPVNEQTLEEVLKEKKGKGKQNPQTSTAPIGLTNVDNPEEYLFLPAKNLSQYNYPDTLISLARKHNGENWFDTHKALAAESSYMPTIRQFVDFVKMLKSGNARNGKGEIIAKNIVDETLDDIFKLGNYRGRWLDADFKVSGGVLLIFYGRKVGLHGGISSRTYAEILAPSTLMTDKKPGIDLEDWLDSTNEQGLPTQNTKEGNFWYFFPRSDDNSVAGLAADSDRTYLGCNRDPSYANSSLGVHAAKNFGGNK